MRAITFTTCSTTGPSQDPLQALKPDYRLTSYAMSQLPSPVGNTSGPNQVADSEASLRSASSSSRKIMTLRPQPPETRE
ncbi:hypothetical protein MJO28_014919 [Puccinia striiformis f. sp. tritici]|uniref:Uncharacterized protein n=1 Tax=Puccinia striiformis f. sp. tritici TaxID=168172 RepID=A0ACC0DR31_9BASI|nr:hypothetical protein MJO29_014686 [Puccinia striiformis f. sp. tritici]KAI7937999.1 hypothetical protein MJO28_014919 [Puccinia striiformis f. sp. tritici]